MGGDKFFREHSLWMFWSAVANTARCLPETALLGITDVSAKWHQPATAEVSCRAICGILQKPIEEILRDLCQQQRVGEWRTMRYQITFIWA